MTDIPELEAVEIEVGGRRLKLCFDMNAFIRLQKSTGQDPTSKEFWEDADLEKVRTVFWVGLQHYHPEIDETAAGALVPLGKLPYLSEKLVEAFNLSAGETESEEPQAQERPTPAALSG